MFTISRSAVLQYHCSACGWSCCTAAHCVWTVTLPPPSCVRWAPINENKNLESHWSIKLKKAKYIKIRNVRWPWELNAVDSPRWEKTKHWSVTLSLMSLLCLFAVCWPLRATVQVNMVTNTANTRKNVASPEENLWSHFSSFTFWMQMSPRVLLVLILKDTFSDSWERL